MAGSRLEEYQRRLEADPASAAFVDLARELLLEGQPARAAEVCLAGVAHHPDLVEGRILCGKALLRLGRATEARAQFEAALARNPRDAEVHATVGEALLERGLPRSALQLVKKAIALEPANPRLRELLARVQDAGATAPRSPPAAAEPPPVPTAPAHAERPPVPAAPLHAEPPPVPTAPAHAEPPPMPAAPAHAEPPPMPAAPVHAEPPPIPAAPAAGPAAVGADVPGRVRVTPDAGELGPSDGPTPGPPPLAAPRAGHAAPAPASAPAPVEVVRFDQRPRAAGAVESGVPDPEKTRIDPFAFDSAPAAAQPAASETAEPDDRTPAGDAEPPGEAPEASPDGPPPIVRAPPPLRGDGRRPGTAASLVDALLGTLPAPPPAGAATPQPADAGAVVEEAASVAAAYERELRERLAAEQARPPSWLRRHRLGIGLGLLLTAFGGAGVATYEYRRAATHAEDVARYTAAARNGLLRDTYAAYRASLTALDEVLDREEANPAARALKAEVLAILARRYAAPGIDAADAAALLGPAESAAEPEAVLATRLLLAEGEARKAVEDEILAVPPERAGATVHSLAGAILLARGDEPRAIERFNAAIAQVPGHAPTLVRVAEHYRSRREFSEALRYDRLALAVVEDHPLALLGAAEANLALGGDEAVLQEALAGLGRIPLEAVPAAERDRWVIAKAKLLAGVERREDAIAELEPLRARAPDDPQLLAALAGAYVAVGAPDRAVELFRADAIQASTPLPVREAWARALLARERFRAVTLVPASASEGSLHLLEGIAWIRLGDRGKARAALRLTATRQAGKMPADAVVYLALADLHDGQIEKARRNLERLGTGPRARSAGRWAWAELLVREGRLAEAEAVLREAVEADRQSVEARCALGRLLLRRGDAAGAKAVLAQAIARNPFHAEAVASLGAAALASGDRAAARAHLAAAIEQNPDQAEALAGLAVLEAREGDLSAADRRLGQATRRAPRAGAVLAAKAEIALLRRDARAALAALEQAVRSEPSDPRLWLRLADLQLATGAEAPARASYAKARRLDPGSLSALLGEARALAGSKGAAGAERLLREKLDALGAEAPPADRARVLAALAEAELARSPADAESHAREAIALAPERAEAHLALGRARGAAGDRAAAEESLRRAHELAPSDLEVLRRFGLWLLESGDRAEGKKVLARYLELTPPGPPADAVRRSLEEHASN